MRTWIFDLDNTLYPPSAGLVGQMNANIRGYLRDSFDCDEAGAAEIQRRLCAEHGTTLRGLMVTRGVDPVHFLKLEHDIDYAALAADPRLAAAIAALPGRKFVLTNSIASHAAIVLRLLGLTDHFEGVFDLLAAQLVPKPHPETYRRFLDQYAIDPLSAVMVDDLAHNLEVPRSLGMHTIWLDPAGDDLATVLARAHTLPWTNCH